MIWSCGNSEFGLNLQHEHAWPCRPHPLQHGIHRRHQEPCVLVSSLVKPNITDVNLYRVRSFGGPPCVNERVDGTSPAYYDASVPPNREKDRTGAYSKCVRIKPIIDSAKHRLRLNEHAYTSLCTLLDSTTHDSSTPCRNYDGYSGTKTCCDWQCMLL